MVEYNPFNRETVTNPYPTYRRLRDEAPVYYNADLDFYALSRYDDVLAHHLDTTALSSAQGVTLDGTEAGSPFLIVKDPPEHTAHRKIVNRVFTPRRVAQLEPFIRARTRECLDDLRGEREFDVIDGLSIRLPLDVISELLGIPESQRARVHDLSDQITTRPDDLADTELITEVGAEASMELLGMLAELVKERRANPGDDVISIMIQAEVALEAGPHVMDDGELAARFLELAFAGHETVAKLIPNGLVALAWYPDQRRELAADRSLVPNAIEETLRWDTSSHFQGRWSTRDIELHGTTIPAGKRVLLLTGAANHDERHFPEPELFDIHREIDRHLSFGFGAHLCLGQSIARLEARVVFEEFLNAFPEYGLSPTGAVRQFGGNVRGLAHLYLQGEPARAGTMS